MNPSVHTSYCSLLLLNISLAGCLSVFTLQQTKDLPRVYPASRKKKKTCHLICRSSKPTAKKKKSLWLPGETQHVKVAFQEHWGKLVLIQMFNSKQSNQLFFISGTKLKNRGTIYWYISFMEVCSITQNIYSRSSREIIHSRSNLSEWYPSWVENSSFTSDQTELLMVCDKDDLHH